mgnify:CR=1 FL=1
MPVVVDESMRMRKMAKLANSFNSVMDIGCAQQPNSYLNNKTVIGLDLVKTKMPNNYRYFYQMPLSEYNQKHETVECIVAGELLEHLEDPLTFLKDCYQAITADGVLILSTPNPLSPIELILNITLNKKYFYTKDHIMLFPQRWLIRLLELAGFNNIKLYSGGFPLPGVGLVPCPRFMCHQTIAVATKTPQKENE